MKKQKLKSFSIIGCGMMFLFSVSLINKNITAEIGYGLAKWAGSSQVAEVATVAAGGAIGTYGGAKLGASIGAIGGPAGSVVGAVAGAL